MCNRPHCENPAMGGQEFCYEHAPGGYKFSDADILDLTGWREADDACGAPTGAPSMEFIEGLRASSR